MEITTHDVIWIWLGICALYLYFSAPKGGGEILVLHDDPQYDIRTPREKKPGRNPGKNRSALIGHATGKT